MRFPEFGDFYFCCLYLKYFRPYKTVLQRNILFNSYRIEHFIQRENIGNIENIDVARQ